MMNIKLMNKIAAVGTAKFDKALYTVGEDVANEDAIMVRSAALHEYPFGAGLKAIARAGAGVNNIPVEDCAKKGIVVFNTPGANANGVKELAICALLLAARDVAGGIKWAGTLTEDAAKAVEKASRSMMNVTFVTGDADLDKKFASEAAANGMQNLKGHRSVGGMRASIYNAMPYEGVEKLVAFMKDFAANNPKA